MHLPGNTATSTPNHTTTHPSSAVETTNVSTPVNASRASSSKVAAAGPAQPQTVTPTGKENEAKQPSGIPSAPPGGTVNPRHSVAGSSGLRNHRVKVIHIFLEMISLQLRHQRVFNVFYELRHIIRVAQRFECPLLSWLSVSSNELLVVCEISAYKKLSNFLAVHMARHYFFRCF